MTNDQTISGRISKNIPAILVLILQFTVGVWWAAKLDARAEYTAQGVAELKEAARDGYTKKDAAQDQRMILKLIDQISARLERLEQAQRATPG